MQPDLQTRIRNNLIKRYRPPIRGDTQVTKELYRYLDVFNISDYGTASDVQKSELIKEIEDTGFYAGMTPANITVETHKVHNYVVY